MGIFNSVSKENIQEVPVQVIQNDAEDQRNALALEAVTSKVMVADENNIIVQVNPSALKMMQNAETDLKMVLPNFSADQLVGSNIDVFHKNPEHQRGMLATLSSTYEGRIAVGARTFDLIASPIFDDSKRKLGTVVEWADVTQKLLSEQKETERLERASAVAADNSRVKTALDSVSSNVMMADTDNTIVYANRAVIAMLQEAERDLKSVLPNFSAATVVGSNVDIFHKNPAHQKSMLSALNTEYRTEIKVGVRTFTLIANPIFDSTGVRQGTVVEWNDRTEELAFENVVNNTIEKAVAGSLSERVDLRGREGFIARVGQGVNGLMDVFEHIIEDAGASISEMAEGRLTRKIEADYQGSFGKLKDDINGTIDKLVGIVSEISESANNVKEGAGEISTGNSNLSQRTEEQAASLEETSAAMEQITTTVQQNAANSVQANTLARGARETAENGGSVVNNAISAMQKISESSNKINDIIGVIDEIAFQTNLLALNAAVEAARAGDQGRGFAVVADEVRSLAGRSATAAKEIKELIKDSGERVEEGSELVNKSGETLEEIVTAVKKVNDIVAEISTASDEQATGLDEINKAVGEMDEMTQQNAALVEEAAAASEALGHQAESLDNLIGFFDIGSSKRTVKSKPAEAVRAPAARVSSPRAPEPKPMPVRATRAAAPEVKAKSATPSDYEEDDKNWAEF